MVDILAANRELETRTVRKTIIRIIPFLFILFIIAFIDRINVSFAALSMNKELGFSNAVYGLGAGIFFIGYFIMELPGNLIMAKVGARLWITRILITWGIISGLTAFVTTPEQFYAVRFLLGVAEASFSPGIAYYLSLWFRNKDFAKAFSLFLTAMPACSVIAAPISSYLLGINWLGWAGWKWLFLLEALPAVAFGLITYFYLTDRPEKAKWLQDDERDWLVRTMAAEKAEKEHKRKYTLMEALTERNVLIMAAGYFFWVTGLYGVTMFMPTLVKSLQASMSNQTVGYLVMIPYFAALIAMVLVGRHSDATGERQYHVAICMIVSSVSLACSAYFADVSLAVTMLFYTICVAGYHSAFGPFWAMPSSYLTEVNAAGAIALINSIGNLGGFSGPYMVGYIRTVTGSFSLGVIGLAICLFLCAVFMFILKKSMKKRLDLDTPYNQSV